MFNYVYPYKDHLGNVRLSYKNTSNTGVNLQIQEENNYYPFGLKHKGYNNVITGRDHKYGFGGKEEQDELGLDWIDITARNYDPALGRWMNIDPHAESYHSFSPFNYTANNPVVFTDPDGKDIRIGISEGNAAYYKDGKLYTDNTYETEYTSGEGFDDDGNMTGFLETAFNALKSIQDSNITVKGKEIISILQESSMQEGGMTTNIRKGSRSKITDPVKMGKGMAQVITIGKDVFDELMTDDPYKERQRSNVNLALSHEVGHGVMNALNIKSPLSPGKIGRRVVDGSEFFASYIENRYRHANNISLSTHYGFYPNAPHEYGQPTPAIRLLNSSYYPTKGSSRETRSIKSVDNGTISYFQFNFRQ